MCLLKVLPKNKHIFLLILLALFVHLFLSHSYTEHYALMAWKVKQLKLIYTLSWSAHIVSLSLFLSFFCAKNDFFSFRKTIVNIWAMNWSSTILLIFYLLVLRLHNNNNIITTDFSLISFPLIFTASFLTAGIDFKRDIWREGAQRN